MSSNRRVQFLVHDARQSELDQPACTSLHDSRSTITQVRQIVEHLDADGNGYMDASEIKVLISKLTGLAIAEIPDDHPEVKMLANVTADALVDKLAKNTDPEALPAGSCQARLVQHLTFVPCSDPWQLIDKFYQVLDLDKAVSPESVLQVKEDGMTLRTDLAPGEVDEVPDSPATPGSPMEAVQMSMF